MYYATQQNDGSKINPNAVIHAFETREEAEAWLRSSWGSEWDQSSIKIEEGEWGDCWTKLLSEPTEDAKWMAPFTLDDLRVRGPGSHPGGPFWWVTPWASVLVVTEAVEIEQ